MEERNKIIDECINKIKGFIRPTCNDHTPFRGACVSCGSVSNPDIIYDTDTVIEELEKLKTNTNG